MYGLRMTFIDKNNVFKIMFQIFRVKRLERLEKIDFIRKMFIPCVAAIHF